MFYANVNNFFYKNNLSSKNNPKEHASDEFIACSQKTMSTCPHEFDYLEKQCLNFFFRSLKN